MYMHEYTPTIGRVAIIQNNQSNRRKSNQRDEWNQIKQSKVGINK